MFVAVVMSLCGLQASSPPGASMHDVYADAQAMTAVFYPELAAPHRYVIWFQTTWRPMSASGGLLPFTAFVEPNEHAVHDGHQAPTHVLQALVGPMSDGTIRSYITLGSRFTHADELSVLERALKEAGRPTAPEVDRLMDAAGARFSPAKRQALLEHVRPVLAEVERRVGTLAIDELIAPGVYVDEGAGVPPLINTWWSLRARSQRQGKRYEVSLSFEPFDGRLLLFEFSPK